MNTPEKRENGWFVKTPDGDSGPWKTSEAAEAAGDDDLFKANILNNKAKQNDTR